MKPHSFATASTVGCRHKRRWLATILLSHLAWILAWEIADAQLVSHINGRGLRGNFTFTVRQHEGSGEQLLVIEAYVEPSISLPVLIASAQPASAVSSSRRQHLEDESSYDSSQPVLFDWSIHSNTLTSPAGSAPATCSSDELGPPVASGIFQNKTLALNQLTKWQVLLSDLLPANFVAVPNSSPTRSLSALLWGKSLRLKLAQAHLDKLPAPPSPPPTQTGSGSGPGSGSLPARAAAGLHRPSATGAGDSSGGAPVRPTPSPRPKLALAGLTPSYPSTAAPIKPSFAPRPKPQISPKQAGVVAGVKPISTNSSATGLSRIKRDTPPPSEPETSPQTSNSTPVAASSPAKPLLLSNSTAGLAPLSTTTTTTSTTTTTTTTTTPDPRAALELATHKRIARLFGRTVVCANIVDRRNVKTLEANFETQIAGKISIRGSEDDTTLIMHNLYHVRSKVTTRHDWRILASDILDQRRSEERCRYLQTVFDPNNANADSSASSKCDGRTPLIEHNRCRMGDLAGKHGQVQVAGQGKGTRATLVDLNLPLSALEGSRLLFIVIYEVPAKSSNSQQRSLGNILACAEIKPAPTRHLEASFNMDGVRGSLRLQQRHASEPTSISYDLFGVEGNTKHLSIRELPVGRRQSADSAPLCSALGNLFDPFRPEPWTLPKLAAQQHATEDHRLSPDEAPSVIRPTADQVPVGNLSSKHGSLTVTDSEYEDRYMVENLLDTSLPLFGAHTVAGRSVLIHKNNGDPWVCATLHHAEEPVLLASAVFHYPIVGQISFTQLANEPHSETNVLVDLYNPNGEKDTSGHNWLVHLKPAMADFYNWSARCESAGEVYDPVLASAGLSADAYSRQCQSSLINEPLRCRAGDLGLKSGHKLSLPLSQANRTLLFYTDSFMPLSRSNSIIGKSIVVYDDQAPQQRGPRLACATVKLVHPMRASVRTWDSGPSIPSNVHGSILFSQESPTRSTQIKIDLSGFNGNVEHYAVHRVWTMEDREFPCSNDSIYDIFDLFDTESSQRLPPSAHYGTSATVDRVKVGDLSRKHGTFEGLQSAHKHLMDLNLPLFAPGSIVGRSLVLRAAVNDFRWVCGNIELDYDKSEAREVVGVASFDEPRSRVAGFVRFTQLEFKDGSLSDTYVQIDLRPQVGLADGSMSAASSTGMQALGSLNENLVSEGHNWAVFVNQVGEDAFIAADDVRCIAAGFKWNPYLAQDQLDSYLFNCVPGEQHACAIGDLGARHGPLTLGQNSRRVVADSNLPLVGNFSVMGRSLVLFDNKRTNVKLACANILPDIHLKSNVIIRRTPSFTVSRFIEQTRSLLGAAEWSMAPELRATKSVANGECVQMTIHFYGQRAHQIQVELNNLITMGTVRKSTRQGVEKISTHYRLCRTGQMQLTSGASRSPHHLQPLGLWLTFTFAYRFLWRMRN